MYHYCRRLDRFSSFQRQLSLYGFLRLTQKGPDRGAYYSELFLRDRPDLVALIPRTRIKGYWVRQSSSPETEPDFYAMDNLGTCNGSLQQQPHSMAWDSIAAAPLAVSPANSQLVSSSNPVTDEELIMLDTEPIPLQQILGSDVFGCWADVNNSLFRHSEWMGPSQCQTSTNPTVSPSSIGHGIVDQQELADFLVDVDLSDNRRDQAFPNQDEHELARIYYESMYRNNGLGDGQVYQV